MTDLIGWWPLHEQSGSAADLSGEGNAGTLSGGLTQGVWGRSGLTSYSLDGTDDYVDTSLSSVSSPLTFTYWFRPADITNLQEVFNNFNTTTSSDLLIRQDGENVRIIADTVSSFTSTVALSKNTWYHISIVINDGVTIFIDGGQTDSDGSGDNTFDTANNFRFGSRADDGSNSYNGLLADARLYDRALSDNEIQELYERGSVDNTNPILHNGDDSGAVSRWEFAGDVTDSWGSNDGIDNTSAGFTSNAIREQAKSFDGTDDYIELPDFGFGNTSSFSISSWVLLNNITSTQGVIGRYDGSNKILDLNWNDSRSVWRYQAGDVAANRVIAEGGTAAIGTWTHLVISYDPNGPTLKIYQNGTQVASETGTVDDFSTTTGPWVGARSDGYAYLDGDIDDVRVYDRVLISSEVYDLYRWGTLGVDLRKELVKA